MGEKGLSVSRLHTLEAQVPGAKDAVLGLRPGEHLKRRANACPTPQLTVATCLLRRSPEVASRAEGAQVTSTRKAQHLDVRLGVRQHEPAVVHRALQVNHQQLAPALDKGVVAEGLQHLAGLVVAVHIAVVAVKLLEAALRCLGRTGPVVAMLQTSGPHG